MLFIIFVSFLKVLKLFFFLLIDVLLFFRDEIALCIEKAYDRIALSEAARMLFFEMQKPMKEYALQVLK